MPVGEASDEMKDRFTRVLKGHIAIARAIFPEGVSGAQPDPLARLPLWQALLKDRDDYERLRAAQ